MKEYGKNKLDQIAKQDDQWLLEAEEDQVNKPWRDLSKKIAVKVLRTLREKGMSQTELADRLSISKQMVSKIVQGRENFKISTICTLELALGVELLEYFISGTLEIEAPRGRYYAKPEIKVKTEQTSGYQDYAAEEPVEHSNFKRYPLAA